METRVVMSELVSRIHAASGVEKGTVSAVLRAFKDTVTDSMRAGKTVDMGRDFGRFTTITRRARRHVVPSGTTVETPPSRKVRFIPSTSALKTLDPID